VSLLSSSELISINILYLAEILFFLLSMYYLIPDVANKLISQRTSVTSSLLSGDIYFRLGSESIVDLTLPILEKR
jgi:hypothetical protein